MVIVLTKVRLRTLGWGAPLDIRERGLQAVFVCCSTRRGDPNRYPITWWITNGEDKIDNCLAFYLPNKGFTDLCPGYVVHAIGEWGGYDSKIAAVDYHDKVCPRAHCHIGSG